LIFRKVLALTSSWRGGRKKESPPLIEKDLQYVRSARHLDQGDQIGPIFRPSGDCLLLPVFLLQATFYTGKVPCFF
jgi:hypothetical protein